MYNLYEGCRKNNVKRVIWASSVHTVGFYPRSKVIDSKAPPRPDSNYGLSKVFGESLAQYYWDKYSPNVQHSIIFGVSNNDSVLIDNKYAKHIGYKPKDNGEEFRSLIEKKDGFIDSADPLVTTHGGYFSSAGHFDD